MKKFQVSGFKKTTFALRIAMTCSDKAVDGVVTGVEDVASGQGVGKWSFIPVGASVRIAGGGASCLASGING